MRPTQTQEERPEHEELLDILNRIKDFLLRHALRIAIGVAVVLLASTVYRWHVDRRDAQTELAWETLSGIPDSVELFLAPEDQSEQERKKAVQACRDLLENAPGTSATPWVLLQLGRLLATGGEWSEAADAYRQLLRSFPGTTAETTALPAYAAVLEQLGEYGEAAGVYEALAGPDGGIHSLDAGRCRELNGEPERAAERYRAFLKHDVPARFRNLAEARLAELPKGKPLRLPPAADVSEPAQPEPPVPTRASVGAPAGSEQEETPGEAAPQE